MPPQNTPELLGVPRKEVCVGNREVRLSAWSSCVIREESVLPTLMYSPANKERAVHLSYGAPSSVSGLLVEHSLTVEPA